MRNTLITVFLVVLTAFPSWGDEDLFVGTFESETRENFGSDTPGEYRIKVARAPNGKYVATIYHRGQSLVTQELFHCPVEKDDYLGARAPGRAEVLCFDYGYGSVHGVLSYSENGIYVPGVKEKYIRNPELIKQEGLKPGDPSLFEARHYKTKYYAHIQDAVRGFRKISS